MLGRCGPPSSTDSHPRWSLSRWRDAHPQSLSLRPPQQQPRVSSGETRPTLRLATRPTLRLAPRPTRKQVRARRTRQRIDHPTRRRWLQPRAPRRRRLLSSQRRHVSPPPPPLSLGATNSARKRRRSSTRWRLRARPRRTAKWWRSPAPLDVGPSLQNATTADPPSERSRSTSAVVVPAKVSASHRPRGLTASRVGALPLLRDASEGAQFTLRTTQRIAARADASGALQCQRAGPRLDHKLRLCNVAPRLMLSAW